MTRDGETLTPAASHGRVTSRVRFASPVSQWHDEPGCLLTESRRVGRAPIGTAVTFAAAQCPPPETPSPSHSRAARPGRPGQEVPAAAAAAAAATSRAGPMSRMPGQSRRHMSASNSEVY